MSLFDAIKNGKIISVSSESEKPIEISISIPNDLIGIDFRKPYDPNLFLTISEVCNSFRNIKKISNGIRFILDKILIDLDKGNITEILKATKDYVSKKISSDFIDLFIYYVDKIGSDKINWIQPKVLIELIKNRGISSIKESKTSFDSSKITLQIVLKTLLQYLGLKKTDSDELYISITKLDKAELKQKILQFLKIDIDAKKSISDENNDEFAKKAIATIYTILKSQLIKKEEEDKNSHLIKKEDTKN